MDDYSEFLKGKTIALVTSGSSLKGQGRGEYIDSFDVVVRLNRALPVPEEKENDVGKRTDVLYNTLDTFADAGGPIEGELWKNCGVKFVCSTYPKSEYFTHPEWSENLNDTIPTRWMSDDVYYPIRENIYGRPSSGTTTLVDILSFDIKKVHLFGLDFFRTLYDSEYLSEGGNISEFENHLSINGDDRHDPDSQYKFFKYDIYPNEDRIEIDSYFEEILNDVKYDEMFFIKE
jgi:hypothetical protein